MLKGTELELRGHPSSRRASTMLVALVLLAVYGIAIGRVLVPAGMNPLAVARLSRDFGGASRFWDQNPVFEQFDGYDGQFYYYIARDPLLGGDALFMDAPAYRYQRILLPALAWLLGLGQAAAIGWSLLAVNVLSLVLGCATAARLFDHFRAPRWWLLAYGLNPGFVLGVVQDLAEPLALALVTAGVWGCVMGRHRTAVGALTLAVLARETTLIVPMGLAAYYLLGEHRTRRALSYCLPLLAFAVWQMVVVWRVGALPVRGVDQILTWPGVGLYQTLRPLLGLESGVSVSDLAGTSRLTGAVGMIAQACAAGLAVASFRVHSLLRWQLALQGLFVLCAGVPIWRDVASFPRDGMLLFFFFIVVVVAERNPSRHAGCGACDRAGG
ncbi:MAG: hypothetical protein M3069_12760 [Chloroflexota bacterium]|nr:hypothetical protein [Chloroflexota bacterium]